MSNVDKLLDLLREPSWSAPSWTTSSPRLVSLKMTEELSIIPLDEKHKCPMLKIERKNEQGETCFVETMNLAAVDERIGELIKMRDLLEQMQPRPDGKA